MRKKKKEKTSTDARNEDKIEFGRKITKRINSRTSSPEQKLEKVAPLKRRIFVLENRPTTGPKMIFRAALPATESRRGID